MAGEVLREALTELAAARERPYLDDDGDLEAAARYERHRNAAIFERQGNRNPLVDHPDWASGIEFSGGL